ncbi:MAG: DUF507 family protein [Myxococcales bacterium]|nr:DUF507 family protein [Myxococcales bacterium]MCB9532992.1 DUF507 family protein [Myxococcales bacterium]
MRLYSGQFRLMATELVKALLDAELIELEDGNVEEAELDLVGVLREYQRMDRQLTQKARDTTATLGKSAEMKEKRRLAKEKNFRVGDDGVEYVVQQMIETLLASSHIEEIFGEDRELRAVLNPIVKRYTASRDDELDAAVRGQIKNLEEGSQAWEIEYERVLSRVKRNKGLEE